MKNLVPPIAHNKPNVTAMCIHNFLFDGFLVASNPDKNKGTPRIDGKYEVIDSDLDKNDIIIPHNIKDIPYIRVIEGIENPNILNSLVVSSVIL